MADFNPANGLIRCAWETTHGIPLETDVSATSIWAYHDFISESLSPEYGTIDRQSISRAGQRPIALPGKITGGGDIEIEWNVEGHLKYMLNIQRYYAVTETVASEVYGIKAAPALTGETAAPSTMTVEVWRDDDMAHLFKGARVSQVSFRFEQESVVQGTVGVHPERADYWGLAATTTDTATTIADLPTVRGLPAYDATNNDWEDTDDLYFVVTAADATTVTLECAIGSAPSTHTAQFQCTVGNDSFGDPIFTRILLDDNSRYLGTKDIPCEIHIPSVTGYDVGDAFTVTVDRGEWSPTYPDVLPFNEIYCFIYIGDTLSGVEEYCIEGIELSIEQPIVERLCIGGRYPKEVFRRGQRVVGGTINREYLSVDLKKKLERARFFALKIQAYTGLEFYTGHEHSLTITAPYCILSGNVPTIAGQEEMPESYEFSCHPSSESGYTDDVTLEIVSSIQTP
jgi:hypothetical protein